MSFRLILGVILSLAIGAPVESWAADQGNTKHHYGRTHRLYYGPYAGRHIGGYANAWLWHPPIFTNKGYNYPGFYNNQTFWERVQTQGNYPVTY